VSLGRLARELGVYVAYGLIERDGDRLFNALVLVGPEGLVGKAYRKIHLPYLGLDRFVTPGDRPFRVEDTPLCRVGLNICYDASFPESARILSLKGSDVILLPTNWPTGSDEFAEHGIPTRALENHVYLIAANRVGEERGFRFMGRSAICSPLGKVLCRGGADSEELLLAEIDPTNSRNKRVVRVPDKHIIDRMRDRRPEFYGAITEPKRE
jgi:predicted amidohydrolase